MESNGLSGIVKVKTLAEKALGNVQHSEIKNVDLLLSDARELCFRDASIDTIVSGKLEVLLFWEKKRLVNNANLRLYRLAMGTSREFVHTNPRGNYPSPNMSNYIGLYSYIVAISKIHETNVSSIKKRWKGLHCHSRS